MKKCPWLLVLLALTVGESRAAIPATNASRAAVEPARASSPAQVIAPKSAGLAPGVGAGRPEVAGWKPMPLEVRRDVDAFFLNLELAIAYNRLDLVMAQYAPDAVEEKPDGGWYDFAGIRQRRQEEMDGYVKAGVKPSIVQRNFLVYKPGATPEIFKVKYPLHDANFSAGIHFEGVAAAGGPPLIDNIVYTFRRGANGLVLTSQVVHASDGTSSLNKAPDLDGPTPTEIRLTNGVTLRQVKVLQWAPDSLLIQHVGGTVPIRMVNIQPDYRAYFAANMDRAVRAQTDAAINTNRLNAAQSQMDTNVQQSQAEMMTRAQEWREAHEQQLSDAISRRQLVVGMTMEQVRRSWGQPSRINQVDSELGHTILWSYIGRGVDEHGAVIDAGVAFIADHVRILLNLRPKDKG